MASSRGGIDSEGLVVGDGKAGATETFEAFAFSAATGSAGAVVAEADGGTVLAGGIADGAEAGGTGAAKSLGVMSGSLSGDLMSPSAAPTLWPAINTSRHKSKAKCAEIPLAHVCNLVIPIYSFSLFA